MADLNDMQISPEEYSLIEDYLDQKLEPSDLEDFELKLAQDQELNEKVRQVQVLRNGIERSQMKSQIDFFHEQLKPENTKSTFTISIGFWLAAACLLLLLSGVIWWTGLFQSTQNQLFETYYQKDPGLSTRMSESSNYEFERGMVDFKTEDYESALDLWQPLLADDPQNDTLQYFVGLSLLEQEDFESSEKYLNQVAENPNSGFYKDASWYFALLLIKEGNFEEAIQYLKSSERKDAESLIKKIQDL